MKELFIFDASPLIYLGKAKILHKVCELSSGNVIPFSVYVEVVLKGKERDETDARHVEALIEQGIFRVQKVTSHPPLFSNISSLTIADIDVLTLAWQEKGRAITDDEAMRMVARIEGIKASGTIFLLVRLVQSAIIPKREAREILDEMIQQGWRCSAEAYSMFLKKFD